MNIDYLALVMRWMHILAVATAVGGSIFMRFALLPSVAALTPEERKTLHERVRPRWARLVMTAISMLTVSGIMSYLSVRQLFIAAGPEHKLPALYNMLFGIKVLLALGIFFLASALSGRSPALEGIRKNTRLWLSINLLLVLLVIGISGVLRAMHVTPNPPTPVTSTESVPVS